jgi:hypothetical protein
MRKSEFVSYVLGLRRGARGASHMREILAAEGFEEIGRGVDKTAWLRPGDRFVVKVRHHGEKHTKPYNPLNRVRKAIRDYGRPWSPKPNTYVPMAYSDGLIQIQAKVSPCLDRPQGRWCYTTHPDGHAGNHTHRPNGKALLFDYD